MIDKFGYKINIIIILIYIILKLLNENWNVKLLGIFFWSTCKNKKF